MNSRTSRIPFSRFFVFCALLLATSAAQAQQPQLELPRPSPKATVMQRVGLTDIVISYARPSVKGRKIFGGLEPYGKVWRTGANEATTISFSDPVTINNQPLPAGRYSLHTIPGQDEWTIIFNRTADQWGSYSYDEKQDALRVRVRPETAPMQEVLTFSFPALTDNSAVVAMHWDTVRVPFTVGVEVNERTLREAREKIASAKADDWRTPFQAAGFAFERNLAADEAMTWVDKSIAARETYGNLALKARMMAKRGDKAQARQLAERAIAVGKAAKPNPADTSAMEKFLAEMK